MPFLLVLNHHWFTKIWLCWLCKVIHVFTYEIAFAWLTTRINLKCVGWRFWPTFGHDWYRSLIMEHKTGVTFSSAVTRKAGLLVATKLDSRLAQRFLVALVFEYSRHVLEICCTDLLYGILCLQLSLILELATVAAGKRANLFECGMLLLSDLTLTELSNLRLPLIARIVIDIGNWRSEWDTCHACSRMIALLRMSSEILTDALRCIYTNLLRIWIVLLSIFLRLFLIGFFSIMSLNSFHTVVWLL